MVAPTVLRPEGIEQGERPELPVADPTDLVPPVDEIDVLVARGLQALDDYADFDQEKIDYIVKKAAVAALDQHGQLAQAAVAETGRGVFEDKAVKNIFAWIDPVLMALNGNAVCDANPSCSETRAQFQKLTSMHAHTPFPHTPCAPKPRMPAPHKSDSAAKIGASARAVKAARPSSSTSISHPPATFLTLPSAIR